MNEGSNELYQQIITYKFRVRRCLYPLLFIKWVEPHGDMGNPGFLVCLTLGDKSCIRIESGSVDLRAEQECGVPMRLRRPNRRRQQGTPHSVSAPGRQYRHAADMAIRQ